MIANAPNVVTEEALRALLRTGYFLEVVCTATAEKRHTNWSGIWVVRAVSEDGRAEKVLVTSRSYVKVREFKTIVGIVSFLADMGCKTVRIPLEEGGREPHAAPGRSVKPRAAPDHPQKD